MSTRREHWVTTLTDILTTHRRAPTADEIDRAVANSEPKTATSAHVHFIAMMGIADEVGVALQKHGIQVVHDGNIYR